MAPRHVLVIDDQPSLLFFLHCSLEERWPGCSVDSARTSKQARALLRRNSYDVILTDYELRDGNGVQLAALLHERAPGVPVVLMTASPVPFYESGTSLRTKGIAALLRKPFDLRQLYHTLETAVDHGDQGVAYG